MFLLIILGVAARFEANLGFGICRGLLSGFENEWTVKVIGLAQLVGLAAEQNAGRIRA
jgi:hypothetical protein